MSGRPRRIWLAAAALLTVGAGSAAPDLTSADRAFIAHDLKRAERLYREVADAETVAPRDRAEALRQLAVLAWRFHREVPEGRALLERALALGADSSADLSALARLEMEAGRTAEAVAAATRAIQTARTEDERLRGLSWLGLAVVRPAIETLVTDGHRPDSAARAQLRRVVDRFESLNRAVPGLLEPSLIQLHGALLLDDGAAAVSAWRSYYLLHLTRGGPLPAAGDTLARVLSRWAGSRAPVADRAAAVRAFAASGQLDAALILAADPQAKTSAELTSGPTADVIAYARYARDVRGFTDEYYRATALGEGDWNAYRARLRATATELWNHLSWPDSTPSYSDPAFLAEARRRFGVETALGRTAGYRDLHMGHRVVDEPRMVEQYGHRAELRYLALDGMISNGFQTWAWDGRQAHGGWANDSTIVQVRPRYATSALGAWRSFTDTVERARLHTRYLADSAADLERARRDPYAYLPGLATRIYLQVLTALRDSLAGAGLTGDSLRAAFLSDLDRATVESSIFAHEGRHAIDRRLGLKLDVWEREYRAKLSEVAFAPRPRIGLHGSILNPNIGDDTPHGRANLAIMKDLVRWMERNATAIPGFDASAPVLPQLSLLSDNQLRAAFRAFDPLAQ